MYMERGHGVQGFSSRFQCLLESVMVHELKPGEIV